MIAEVKPGDTAVASAATGFLWFLDSSTDKGINNIARLGTASVMERTQDAMAPALDAGTGLAVRADSLVEPGSVSVTVEGDFSIGAFELDGFDATDEDMEDGIDVTTMFECPAAGAATLEMPVAGNINMAAAAGEDPNSATIGMLSSGMYELCVQVDTQGPNTMAIPKTTYTGTISLGAGPTASVLHSGPIGVIDRDGAEVDIAYLTTSDKHNQRLIIVNRGDLPIMITDIDFQVEDGTEADLSDAAKAATAIPGANEIGAGKTVVHRVNQMLSITGESRRTAVTLSFNGAAEDISVATTQVNLSDDSTDTVMWDVK